jgi:hypothetical protein
MGAVKPTLSLRAEMKIFMYCLRFLPAFDKELDIEAVHIIVLNSCEFCENQHIERHILLEHKCKFAHIF